jgi:hypothetical protein
VDEPKRPNVTFGDGHSKLIFDDNHHNIHLTPIVDKIGDTISLHGAQVRTLIQYLQEWLERDD